MSHRSLRKSFVVLVAIALVSSLAILLQGSATANHGTRTLQVEPEVDTNPAGTTHTLTATLSEAATTGTGSIQVDFEIESGPPVRVNCTGAEEQDCTGGTPNNDGDTPNSPDMTCEVPVGSSTCQVSFTSEQEGTNLVRAWIDHDKNNATVEADRNEGRISDECSDDEVDPDDQPIDCDLPLRPLDESEPGDRPEPDDTDVVEKTWLAGEAAILDCDPETATNPSSGEGSAERYTCTVTDRFGNPIEGAHVDGENMNGANDPDSSPGNPAPTTDNVPDYDHQHDPGEPASEGGGHFCVTNAEGTCSDTVRAIDGESGTALICFFASAEPAESQPNFDPSSEDQGVGGDCDSEQLNDEDDDMTDVVQKTWQTREARGVDAEPETATNDVGDEHTITATVYDQFDAEYTGPTTVNFEFFSGSPGDIDGNSDTSTPDRTCSTSDDSTESDSSCSITYTATETGQDTVCVYIGDPPTTNTSNRTCGGEGLTDPDDDPEVADPPPSNSNQRVDVVEKHWVEPTPGLDCEPEQDTNPQRSSHTVTCHVRDEEGEPRAGSRVHAEATGANDPDNGDSPETPDFTCTTAEDDNPLTLGVDERETCSFTHGPGDATSQPGTTTYRAWIDEDENEATFDGDATEGPNAGAPGNPGADEAGATGPRQPGSQPEPDNTDVVQKHWVPEPATLTMEPESDEAKVGTCNPYTITVLDGDEEPAVGATIDVEQRHENSDADPEGDSPRVLFCRPSQGPNPSDVNTEEGDLSPPEEDPDDPGTLGGETVQQTDANGQVTIGIGVQPANGSDGSGNVTITAWYEEEDNDDPDEGEPQDTSTKTWLAAEGRNIVCSPRQDTNPTGTTHTVTCTVTDRESAPAPGESVTWTESGPGSFTSETQTTTDENGRTQATTTSDEPGDQTITATLTNDTGSGEPEDVDECDRAADDPEGAPEGNCSDSVQKTWVQEGSPSPTDDDEVGRGEGRRMCNNANAGTNRPLTGGGRLIVGTPGDDALVGTGGPDIICGLGGDDSIQGRGGNDLLKGGGGNDTIKGGGGDDDIRGGGGHDQLRGGQGDDSLRGGKGNDQMRGGAGNDLLRGGRGHDTLLGGKGSDTMRGARGQDVLRDLKGRGNIFRGGPGNNDTAVGRANRGNVYSGIENRREIE